MKAPPRTIFLVNHLRTGTGPADELALAASCDPTPLDALGTPSAARPFICAHKQVSTVNGSMCRASGAVDLAGSSGKVRNGCRSADFWYDLPRRRRVARRRSALFRQEAWGESSRTSKRARTPAGIAEQRHSRYPPPQHTPQQNEEAGHGAPSF